MDEVNPIHESIKQTAYWLQAHGWPGVWQWIQKKVNTGAHPVGINYTLACMKAYNGEIKNRWAYAETVYKIKGVHGWEADHQREAELERLELDELVNDLKRLRGK